MAQATPLSFTSPVSPRSQPAASSRSYFTNAPSPDLGNTAEQHRQLGFEPAHSSPTISRHGSVSSISFQTLLDLPSPVWGLPKNREGRIRTSSPPAPSRFEHHVSFDNFGGGEATERNTISFTLNVKHTGYQYKRQSRTFLVGIDENTHSDYALQWMLEELVDDGDEIVCLRVVDKDAKINSDKSMDKKAYREEANLIMQAIQSKNDENRAISIVLEFAVGKLHTTFQKMIQLYEPSMLIVGTRGRSLGGFQGLVSNRNSFSKWCLQYSPIPVVVVRPTEKRDKKKQKRINDPTRQSYLQILHDSGHTVHEASGLAGDTEKMLPPISADSEAHEVASALHLPAQFDPTLKPLNLEAHRLRHKPSGRSDTTSISRRSSSAGSREPSPGLIFKSPKSNLDSPVVTDDDSEGEFEAVSGQSLLGAEPEAVEKQLKLHQMELGEAAALHGRKASIASIDSKESGLTGGADDDSNEAVDPKG